MSIATELTALQSNLANAKTAVTNKGGTVGDTGLAGLASEIATIPSGGTPEVEKKDINFYDYDGTRVASWTLSELSEATALPENPTHQGLVADGWNWTLAQLKTQNSKMNVGQHYTPADGSTHIFVNVDSNFKNPTVGIGLNGTATIDWGDGNTSTLTGSNANTRVETSHTYSTAGKYEVTIALATGSQATILGVSVPHLWRGPESTFNVENVSYASQVEEIWIGNNMTLGTSSYNFPFIRFVSLKKLTMPLNTTLATGCCIALYGDSLEFVSFPLNATSVGAGSYSGVKVCSLPPTITEIADSGFTYCLELEDITFPNSITKYNASAFNLCPKLMKVRISKNVTNIYSRAFGDNYLQEIDLSAVTSVPTITANTFISASECKGLVIKVPQSLLASFQSASQWSNYSSYMVGV